MILRTMFESSAIMDVGSDVDKQVQDLVLDGFTWAESAEEVYSEQMNSAEYDNDYDYDYDGYDDDVDPYDYLIF